jgi:hypothetical protein
VHITPAGEREADGEAGNVPRPTLLGIPNSRVDPGRSAESGVAEVEPDPGPLPRIANADPGLVGADVEGAVPRPTRAATAGGAGLLTQDDAGREGQMVAAAAMAAAAIRRAGRERRLFI